MKNRVWSVSLHIQMCWLGWGAQIESDQSSKTWKEENEMIKIYLIEAKTTNK